jgi:hypothetical protein
MATAAQIEANRKNVQKSAGPRTAIDEGANWSRFNALDRGSRANILVLPTEDFGEYETEANAWKLSWQPRNPVEEFLVDRIVSLSWQAKRIDRAQTARLAGRIHRGDVEEVYREKETVIEMGQQLFRDACGPLALHLENKLAESISDGDTLRISDYSVDEDHPMRLIIRLQGKRAGCEWLLDQWAGLRALLARGVPWLAPDKLKAVRVLGCHPIDAVENLDVAKVYLATHALLKQEGDPFQEILNELSRDEASVYADYLRRRRYDALAPKNTHDATEMLINLMDRAIEPLHRKAELLREIAELDALSAADRLSWDDTAEGERVRRYELTCNRTLLRMFELLLKVRRTGDDLGLDTIPSIGRIASSSTIVANDRPAPAVTTAIVPPPEPAGEPDPPSEANSEHQSAPNEANFNVQAPSTTRSDGHTAFRIDTPHLDRNSGKSRITSKDNSHPALQRLLTDREAISERSGVAAALAFGSA